MSTLRGIKLPGRGRQPMPIVNDLRSDQSATAVAGQQEWPGTVTLPATPFFRSSGQGLPGSPRR
jgi:hypothetical protein